MIKAAIIDFETTGLDAKIEDIIEVGALIIDLETGNELSRFEQLIKPKRIVSEQITKITKISSAMLEYCPDAKEVLTDLNKKCEGCIFFAQNAFFDVSFYLSNCERYGVEIMETQCYDTLQLFRYSFGGLKSHSLTNLKEKLNIVVDNSHRAFDDCLATFLIMKKACQTLGINMVEMIKMLKPIPVNKNVKIKNAGGKYNWEVEEGT